MRFVFGSLVLATGLLFTGVASAQGPAAPITPDRPTPVAPPAEESHKQITVNVNPLSFGIGRYGADLQYLPAMHHAIVVNPFFAMTKAEITAGQSKYEQTFSGIGGELGYRFYSGERGANGFFVGPSLIAGTYSASATGAEKVSFNSIGYAVDIGGQHVFKNGFTIGGGFGMQYTKVNKDFFDLPVTAGIIAGGGWRPRFLLALGYSFG
jgi:hypothetical protein